MKSSSKLPYLFEGLMIKYTILVLNLDKNSFLFEIYYFFYFEWLLTGIELFFEFFM
jgi:hypothetical protein